MSLPGASIGRFGAYNLGIKHRKALMELSPALLLRSTFAMPMSRANGHGFRPELHGA